MLSPQGRSTFPPHSTLQSQPRFSSTHPPQAEPRQQRRKRHRAQRCGCSGSPTRLSDQFLLGLRRRLRSITSSPRGREGGGAYRTTRTRMAISRTTTRGHCTSICATRHLSGLALKTSGMPWGGHSTALFYIRNGGHDGRSGYSSCARCSRTTGTSERGSPRVLRMTKPVAKCSRKA